MTQLGNFRNGLPPSGTSAWPRSLTALQGALLWPRSLVAAALKPSRDRAAAVAGRTGPAGQGTSRFLVAAARKNPADGAPRSSPRLRASAAGGLAITGLQEPHR